MRVNYRTDKRFTLCLDEFPYLVEQSSELPSVLQKLVDEKQLKYNLVLCGSSQNMMYGLFLGSAAPLYEYMSFQHLLPAPLKPDFVHNENSFPTRSLVLTIAQLFPA